MLSSTADILRSYAIRYAQCNLVLNQISDKDLAVCRGLHKVPVWSHKLLPGLPFTVVVGVNTNLQLLSNETGDIIDEWHFPGTAI
jgi:hypothetical protein